MAELVAKMITEDTTQTQGQVIGLVADQAKTTEYLLWVQTPDATPKEMSLDSLDQDFLETADNKAYALRFDVVAKIEGSQECAFFYNTRLVHRGTGFATTVILQAASALTPEINTAGMAAVTLTVDVDTATDGRIKLTVTGIAATVINWTARVNVTEIGL